MLLAVISGTVAIAKHVPLYADLNARILISSSVAPSRLSIKALCIYGILQQ